MACLHKCAIGVFKDTEAPRNLKLVLNKTHGKHGKCGVVLDLEDTRTRVQKHLEKLCSKHINVLEELQEWHHFLRFFWDFGSAVMYVLPPTV